MESQSTRNRILNQVQPLRSAQSWICTGTHPFTFLIIILFLSSGLQAQETEQKTQTIRGTVLDVDSRMSLPGATVMILGSDPLIGTSSDMDGRFNLENVPVGRVDIQCNFLGYEGIVIPNIVVSSGKESIVEIQLSESLYQLNEVVVKAHEEHGEPLNEMALLSARSISTEEMNRLTAGFNDPALIASSYAGVANSGIGGNAIIVRGNSPKYLQWRLEGVPITNPNHFADQNAALGSTSTLNSNLLARSDFYTGAFPAEFGNALAGVYDIKLRNGNNRQLEKTVGIGLLGTDLTLEGPFAKGYEGSFLVNYRYSTVSIFNTLGLLDVEGEPIFQDAAFKLNLPTRKFGTFSIFGLGGHSKFALENTSMEDWDVPGDDIMNGSYYEDYSKESALLNTGINHSILIDDKSYLKSSLSYSNEGIDDHVMRKTDSLGVGTPSFSSDLDKNTYQASSAYHRKVNARSSYQIGSIYTIRNQKFDQARMSLADSALVPILDFNERIGNMRSFISWKQRLGTELTLVAGLHSNHVFLTNENLLEARLAASWQVNAKNSINIGYGKHSTMESVHHYFAEIKTEDGSMQQINQDLQLLKAHHLVLGYDHNFSSELHAKVELYYQHLYDLPVENDDQSSFSTINEGDNIQYYDLVNEGTGKNYGIEFTLQRFFANDYYFLLNTSIYESKYKAKDGHERNTKYNGNYLVNIIGGKEFAGLGKEKNKTLGLNAKFFAGGGQKVIPLLRDSEGNLAVDPENNEYWDNDRAYEKSLADLSHLSISASWKTERKSATHELFLNLENITNNTQNLTEFYDPNAPNKVGNTTQFGILPNLMYRIYF